MEINLILLGMDLRIPGIISIFVVVSLKKDLI